LDYPKKFAELWMENIKIQENGINIDHIERGMLLGYKIILLKNFFK